MVFFGEIFGKPQLNLEITKIQDSIFLELFWNQNKSCKKQ
jgi:hypothetical protein